MVEHLLHELEIQCPAAAIPERFVVNVNSLGLDESVTAGQIEIPQGAKLLTEADRMVVQCVLPAVEEDAEAEIGETAEPEIIGRKAEEGESGEAK